MFELTSSSEEVVGLRHRLTWQFSVVRDGRARETVEQVAFLDIGPNGIERIDLLCSGFQLEPGVTVGPVGVFEAGEMGCADGLAQSEPVRPDPPAGWFRVELEEMVVTSVGRPPDHLVIESWHPDRGLQRQQRH